MQAPPALRGCQKLAAILMKAEAAEKKFSLRTRTGCLRLLAIFLCGILLFSFFASLISSSFGQVKISHLKVDARGAELDMDFYVPVGVSDSDSLPCLILAHGRGATKNVMRGFAEEFSRRGYVVVNVNAYGMGLSEQPVSDDSGNGAESFIWGNGSFGLIDTLNYFRTLTYVDQERIAMLGHSFGSGRSSSAAVMDCGYYTLNDRLINILCDVFGLHRRRDHPGRQSAGGGAPECGSAGLLRAAGGRRRADLQHQNQHPDPHRR